MQEWIVSELRHVQLGDMRLNKRLAIILDDWSRRPMASITQASAEWSDAKATYRFLASEKFSAADILSTHKASTLERMSGEPVVLIAQDTSELDLNCRKSIRGLGPLDNKNKRGLKVHSCLAMQENGTPLGIAYQHCWARAEDKVTDHHKRVTRDKESQKWLDAHEAVCTLASCCRSVVEIADQEADVFDLFAAERPDNVYLLVRCAQNRRLADGCDKLFLAMLASPVSGSLTLDVTAARGREPRKASICVRYRNVELAPPAGRPKSEGLEPVSRTYILAQETQPPAGEEPVRWLLATTLAVEDLEDALRCVRWYSYRWKIERYHYVLKSGCRIEQLQLESAEGITKALAIYSMVAWRLLWMNYKVRQTPDAPASVALSKLEWQALVCYHLHISQPPQKPPTLRQAIRLIARLGGFLGRTHDGEPGVTTLWRGMQRLSDITTAYQAFTQPAYPGHHSLNSPLGNYG